MRVSLRVKLFSPKLVHSKSIWNLDDEWRNLSMQLDRPREIFDHVDWTKSTARRSGDVIKIVKQPCLQLLHKPGCDMSVWRAPERPLLVMGMISDFLRAFSSRSSGTWTAYRDRNSTWLNRETIENSLFSPSTTKCSIISASLNRCWQRLVEDPFCNKSQPYQRPSLNSTTRH